MMIISVTRLCISHPERDRQLTVTIEIKVEKSAQNIPVFNFYKDLPWDEVKKLVLEPGDEILKQAIIYERHIRK